jgi:hypothetical protein
MAADSVLFIGWDRGVHGKEKEALEAFGAALAWWGQQVAAGKVESAEPILLDPHGGDLNGFMLVRGSAAVLAELRDSEEFRDLVVRADMSVRGIGVIAGKCGEGVGREMARFQRHL